MNPEEVSKVNVVGKKWDVKVTRVFDAPRELVWKAWTDPEHVKMWWGPKFFTCLLCQMDFREGGTTLVAMRTPDGTDHYITWRYEKIIPLEQIEMAQNLSDEDGKRIDPVSVGMREDFPGDVRTIITFKSIGRQTEMTMTEYGFPDLQLYEMAESGLNQCLDKMAESFQS